MVQQRKIAVIGAGPTGLVGLKEALAEGHDAVLFEARPRIGGQWTGTMYDCVEINSCRDTTSFSDFPLDPARYEQFFGRLKMAQYLNEYMEYFSLAKYIRLNTKVVEVEAIGSEDSPCVVRTQKAGTDAVDEDTYDAVLICTGLLATPSMPEIGGRDKFEGMFEHSHVYKNPEPYQGKKVVVLGLGSSAIDISSNLVGKAREVHLVTRRGGWVLPKWAFGKPAEAWDNRATQIWVSHSISGWFLQHLCNFVAGHPPPLLQPSHGIYDQTPSCQETFLPFVRKGKIKVHRSSIKALDIDKVILDDGTTLDDVDCMISATGYDHTSLPFSLNLNGDTATTKTIPPHLYMKMVPQANTSLFFLGFISLFGPHMPGVEAQARWAAATLSRRIPLPSPKERMKSLPAKTEERHKSNTFAVEYIDSLLEQLGAKPTFWDTMKKGVGLGMAVFFGVTSSAQWRLDGHGANAGLAKETILRVAGEGKEMSSGEKKKLEEQREMISKYGLDGKGGTLPRG